MAVRLSSRRSRSAELTTKPSRMRQKTTQLVSGSGEAQRPTGSNRTLPETTGPHPEASAWITRMGQFVGVLGTGPTIQRRLTIQRHRTRTASSARSLAEKWYLVDSCCIMG